VADQVTPEPDDSEEELPTGRERILFVDDEELLCEMAEDMLTRLGYAVTTRSSSLDALQAFENQPSDFDLVITDQTMPGMTGETLARRMLQIRPDLPVIICTGFSTIMSAKKAESVGIKAFALKPLVKKEIARLIRQVLDK
jgi:DNA-binding NtrC family response regulator